MSDSMFLHLTDPVKWRLSSSARSAPGGTDEWRAEGADQSDADAPPPNKHV